MAENEKPRKIRGVGSASEVGAEMIGLEDTDTDGIDDLMALDGIDNLEPDGKETEENEGI